MVRLSTKVMALPLIVMMGLPSNVACWPPPKADGSDNTIENKKNGEINGSGKMGKSPFGVLA